MDASQIETFLHRLGCEKIKNSGLKVKSTCPFARWLHSGGRDKHPSFAVFVGPGDESKCFCMACRVSGPLLPMLWKLENFGASHPELALYLAKYNQRDLNREPPVVESDIKARLRRIETYEDIEPEKAPRFVEDDKQATVPEEILRSYREIPEEIRQWLYRRGLTDATIGAWELGWHPTQHRVVIPIRDSAKVLVAVSGRTLDNEGGGPKYLHSRFKRDRVLYGEHKIVPGRVGYLCEGFFHVMYLHQLGYANAVARMGTHLSAEQAQKLVTCFTELVIIPDGDVAGRTSAAQIAELLKTKMPVRVVEMPDGKDVDALPERAVHELLGAPNSDASRRFPEIGESHGSQDCCNADL